MSETPQRSFPTAQLAGLIVGLAVAMWFVVRVVPAQYHKLVVILGFVVLCAVVGGSFLYFNDKKKKKNDAP